MRKQSYITTLCALATTFALGMFGAEHKFPDYPTHAASEYATKTERGGLVVGVQPVEDLAEQKTYFNSQLTPKGLLPVFIVLQNGSEGDSFLFDTANIGYSGGAGNVTPDMKSKPGEILAGIGLGSPGIIALKLISNASQVQQNMLKKQVQSRTLSPGTSLHGFLYIPVPKNGERERIHLQIPVTKAGTSETYVLNLFF